MDFYRNVYDVLLRIPKGKVATYGQIAMLCGRPRASRAVGYVLHKNPRPGIIPCHRVVFKDGSLTSGFAFGGREAQMLLLLNEGVEVNDFRVDLEKYCWKPETEDVSMNIAINQLKNEEIPYKLLLEADPDRKMIDRYIKDGMTFIAKDGQTTAGCYVLSDKGGGVFELMNIAVAEHFRGKGIGKALVLHAIESARASGCTSLEVGTGNSSIDQLAFYQKCGFRIVGVDLDFFTRNYSEAIYENGILCRDMIRLKIDL